ncbi:MAG: 2-oxo acid dehydrogenase subunit E2 [Acidimicrobiia bacterium]|nr:2-oxo acid dehydrogenase subunit E2 [Acidimicrobiia bacterium]
MIDFTLPSLGADMDEAMLVGWLVSPGDEVSRGDIIAEVETDKGVMEVECWDEGIIDELLVEPSATRLAVGTPLARIRPMSEAPAVEREPDHEPVAVGVAAPPPPHVTRTVSPPVRHLAHQLGVDVDSVAPTGPEGTVTRDDVRRAAGRRRVSPRARRLAMDMGIDLSVVSPTGPEGMVVVADLGDVEPEAAVPTVATEPAADDPAIAMRRAIARSMARSNREIPQYSLVTQIDMKRALDWLNDANAERPVTARLLPAAVFAKATALALREVSELNGHYVDDRFEQSDDIHLGMAISLRTGGLVAPAIRNADALTLDELMAALDDLVRRARSWKLRTSEMASATATLTNLGDRGVGTAFPIVIPPQVAIVGLGRVMDRPVAIDGMLAVRPTVDATLTADHRVSDGHRGGLFLSALEQRLQEPEKL